MCELHFFFSINNHYVNPLQYMKIGIIGTRGIPNNYSGFEQFAEYLSDALVQRGHAVTVYNSHNHKYQQPTWRGVRLIHCYDPEDRMGSAGQFVYDYHCLRHARGEHYDIILQLGYNSNSIWHRLLPKDAIVITNMDGLEWKRTKFSPLARLFLRYAEYLAVKHSDYLIADSPGIQAYLEKKYRVPSRYIPYGAHVFTEPDRAVVTGLDLAPYGYDMLIARLEPENNIEMILEGFCESHVHRNLVVVGNYFTTYGQHIREKFTDDRIRFFGRVFDMALLNNLRYFSNLYFHGHSVGGTNPSLLEAMASEGLICAHDNVFNQAVLGADGYYFSSASQVTGYVNTLVKSLVHEETKLHNNRHKIEVQYHWPRIISQCEDFMQEVLDHDGAPHRAANAHQVSMLAPVDNTSVSSS